MSAGLSTARRRTSTVLLAVGYPVATVAGAKLLPVLCERRTPRFLAFEGATGAVVVGLALRRRRLAAAANATFLTGVAAAWWAIGRHRR